MFSFRKTSIILFRYPHRYDPSLKRLSPTSFRTTASTRTRTRTPSSSASASSSSTAAGQRLLHTAHSTIRVPEVGRREQLVDLSQLCARRVERVLVRVPCGGCRPRPRLQRHVIRLNDILFFFGGKGGGDFSLMRILERLAVKYSVR